MIDEMQKHAYVFEVEQWNTCSKLTKAKDVSNKQTLALISSPCVFLIEFEYKSVRRTLSDINHGTFHKSS